MNLFIIKLKLHDEYYEIGYASVDSCLQDQSLRSLFDSGAEATIWSGKLKITGPIRSWQKLQESVVANAATLLRPTIGANNGKGHSTQDSKR